MSVLAIVGPTASGKSRLAQELAPHVHGEIVSTDSMAIYRGMDIGTAKPTVDEREAVTHHMIDVRDPVSDVTVAEFQTEARSRIRDIQTRGQLPIVVGGSGLYVSAILDDLRFPGTDAHLRAQLIQECEELGPVALHERLAELDPAAAAAIDPHNARRIVRALEVITLTGGPFPARLPRDVEWMPARRIGLQIEREVLDARIAERVDQMWAAGFVDEVRRLAQQPMSRTARKALGYAQVLSALAGSTSFDQARAETIEATRKFARRQQRWFQRDGRIQWVPYDIDIVSLRGMLT